MFHNIVLVLQNLANGGMVNVVWTCDIQSLFPWLYFLNYFHFCTVLALSFFTLLPFSAITTSALNTRHNEAINSQISLKLWGRWRRKMSGRCEEDVPQGWTWRWVISKGRTGMWERDFMQVWGGDEARCEAGVRRGAAQASPWRCVQVGWRHKDELSGDS